ncbi:MAG: hypothetical protein QOI12_4547 [Alphaproteobacteria bacterium]|jgi:uncharacterized secreted repeat protein (TIGR03808 family)|nr:hypothetical protein [Alphaproteobacteria bacterium]
MLINRRRLLALSAATALSGAAASVTRAAPAAPISALGLDAAQFGLRAGSPDDQSRMLQRAVDEAVRVRAPLAIAPGVYRAANIKLPPAAQLIGVRGATKFVLTEGASLFTAERADNVTLSGLVCDGLLRRLPERRGLVHVEQARGLKIADCTIANAGGNAIHCVAVEGQVVDTALLDCVEAAIHSFDARGLMIARNTIIGAGNNGIQVWREKAGDDGTIVADNRILRIDNRSGGSGQYGNAVNVFRAGNVIVRGNRIDNCAFSAVRGNAASNIHIDSNAITNTREVALYSEFGFEGALIANNTIDGAAIGVSVTNFNEGGRLAVVQGNIIRNLFSRRPAGTDAGDGAGIGIAVEADAAVTGNVVENAPFAGLMLGFGQYLRDVAATGNVVRKSDIGIAVSVSTGAGTALIANNVIADVTRGAILGMDRRKIVTGDLMKGGVERYANLTISGNRVR